MAKKVTPAKLSPARLVATRFGGIRPLARLLDQDPSSISKWIARGGKIPNSSRHGDTHKRLLALAKKERVKLTAEELTFGGEA
jgi:hypothetical protein